MSASPAPASPSGRPAAPSLSVILACLNPGPRLPATIASLREQRYIQAEIIVVDRGSTDGTRDWLATQLPSSVTVLLADGTDHFGALNLALAAAHGDWLLFMAPGDRLVGEVVLDETLNWAAKTEAGVVVGEAAYDDGHILKLPSRVNAAARNFVPPSTTFYRRSLFSDHEPFDLTLPAAADYEFHARLWKSRVRFKPIPLRIAACTTHTPIDAYGWLAIRESMTVRHRYFSFGRSVWWDLSSIFRFLAHKLTPSR